jgi:putative heme-binding domain-containing protein
MKYGPDGAVYFTDWSDQQHCHNPNTEKWDRTNGRLYRMVWEKTYKPIKVDLSKSTAEELVDFQTHKNAWFSRTSRRLLAERAANEKDFQTQSFNEIQNVRSLIRTAKDPASRLNALWTSALVQVPTKDAYPIRERFYYPLLLDSDESIRFWALQLVDMSGKSGVTDNVLSSIAKDERSPIVRRAFASKIQQMSETLAWSVAESLAQHAEDKNDSNIPKLLFQSIAQRMTNAANIWRALEIANNTKIPQLADWIYWFGVTSGKPEYWKGKHPISGGASPEVAEESEGPLKVGLARAGLSQNNDRFKQLSLLNHALLTRSGVQAPLVWNRVSSQLYSDSDPRIVRLAESIAASLGDHSRFPSLRETLQNTATPTDDRKHAFAVLTRAQDTESLPAFLQLLDDKNFKSTVIPQLARYDSPEIPKLLINHFPSLNANDRAAALNVLTARSAYALALLDAVAANKISRDQLSAFQIRQLQQLDNPEVEKRAAAVWGRFNKTSAEKKTQIAALEKTFNEAPLWAYSAQAGRQHFITLCAQCHKLGDDGVQFGPELTGASRHGITYFLENIIDPNAVVGADFQMTNIETKDGETITGLLAAETDTTVTIRNQTEKRTIPKDKIAKRQLSEKSIMPENLLESLPPREQLELLKYLTSK